MPKQGVEGRKQTAFLNRWLPWTPEVIAYGVIGVLAFLSRLWMLGARTMSHDESLHVVYSWNLFMGRGFEHSPMMHGPFLFHLNAFIYFLFGDSDATSRLGPALFGVALVLFPILLRPWIGRMGALSASVLFLLSPAILYHSRYIRHDIYAAFGALLLFYLAFRYLHEPKDRWLYGTAAALAFLLITKEVAFMYGAILGSFLVLTVLGDVWQKKQSWREHPATELAILLLTLVLPFATAFPVKFLLHADPADYTSAGIMRSAVVFAILFGISVAVGYFFLRQRWWVAAGIFYAITTVFFTTFFTNYKGLGTGFVGSLGYWLNQQGVKRGQQPWYYYLLLIPEYEFLPLWLSIGGVIAWLRGRPKPEEEGPDPSFTRDERYLFITFLVWWTALTWVLYTWAGEKMPWLAVHFAVPMGLLGGWFVGRLIALLDWTRIRNTYGLWIFPAFPLALYFLVRVFKTRPFASKQLADLQSTVGWLIALALLLALIGWMYTRWRALGTSTFTRTLFLSLTAFLALWTLRVTWYFNYINYDYPIEQMVYAHGSPDVKLVMGQIEDISRRMYGDLSVVLPYDDDSTWPLEWYVRNYPNKRYYAATPSKETFKDAPIAIAGSKNVDKVENLLKLTWREAGGYEKYRYRLIWWPLESYKGGLKAKILELIRDPEARKRFLDAVLWRRYQYATYDWPFRHDFYFFVRRDVVQKMWDWGVPIGAGAVEKEVAQPEKDVYEAVFREWPATRQLGSGPGSGPGQFMYPRNVALGPDGSIYVADSGNHRIVKFDPQGQYLLAWGQKGQGPGEFNEPWGIAVDKDGFVYVADTWNHRVQKFDSSGAFITQWGYAAMTGGQLTEPGAFFGPRAVAIGKDGNIYVTDTGNKRVQVFTPEGKFVAQYGGAGVEPGQFDEPVGIAVDGDGYFYVADTWNQRVQVFDPKFTFVRAWPVDGWYSESVVNKPYIAVDGKRRVYVTDPENYRVIVFDATGQALAVFGQYGTDMSSFGLPNGIAIDAQGYIYVADADNHRILLFPPLPD
ncbi:MAG: TIGR03663 family protein [Chloroflexi bacterium]|nr:TIGR03663 family protein [Chloroflexota bacterium]